MPLDLELQILHTTLLGGDLRAASRIVERALPAMVRTVRTQVPKLHDGHEDACLQALLDYLQKPAAYDPERASLLSYLVGKATSGARTSVRAQNRRQQHEGQFAVISDHRGPGPPARAGAGRHPDSLLDGGRPAAGSGRPGRRGRHPHHFGCVRPPGAVALDRDRRAGGGVQVLDALQHCRILVREGDDAREVGSALRLR